MINIDIVKRAEDIAARDGGTWADHLDVAHIEAHQPPLEKLVRKSDPKDEALRKAAVLAALHHLPGTGNPSPQRRIEIGECETQLGRVRVSIERDSVTIHGVSTLLSDLDRDLKNALVSTSAAFFSAVTDEEQTTQRALVSLAIDGVLRRHEFLSAKVKEAKTR
jgi:hypothetical protein